MCEYPKLSLKEKIKDLWNYANKEMFALLFLFR
jgi:hypothetical protein